MLETISRPGFAANIISRYVAVPSAWQPSADMFTIRAEESGEAENPFARGIQNIRLINQAITENTVLNLNIHLGFLSAVLSKAAGMIHESAARHILMLEKESAGAGRRRNGSPYASVPVLFAPYPVQTSLASVLSDISEPAPQIADVTPPKRTVLPVKPETTAEDTGGRKPAGQNEAPDSERFARANVQKDSRIAPEIYRLKSRQYLHSVLLGLLEGVQSPYRELWRSGTAVNLFSADVIPASIMRLRLNHIPDILSVYSEIWRGRVNAPRRIYPAFMQMERQNTFTESKPVAAAGIPEFTSRAVTDTVHRLQNIPAKMEKLDGLHSDAAFTRAWENAARTGRDVWDMKMPTEITTTSSVPLAGIVTGQIPAAVRQKTEAIRPQSAWPDEPVMRTQFKSANNPGSLLGMIYSFIPVALRSAYVTLTHLRPEDLFRIERAAERLSPPVFGHTDMTGQYAKRYAFSDTGLFWAEIPPVSGSKAHTLPRRSNFPSTKMLSADTARRALGSSEYFGKGYSAILDSKAYPAPRRAGSSSAEMLSAETARHALGSFEYFGMDYSAILDSKAYPVPRRAGFPSAEMPSAETVRHAFANAELLGGGLPAVFESKIPPGQRRTVFPLANMLSAAQTDLHLVQTSPVPVRRNGSYGGYGGKEPSDRFSAPSVPGAAILYRKETAEHHEGHTPGSKKTGNDGDDIEFITKTVKKSSVSADTRQVNTAVNLPYSEAAGPGKADGVFDIDRQANAIADKVYNALERRLRSERMRKGLL